MTTNAPPPRPVATTLRLFAPALWVLLLAALLVGAVVGAAAWALRTEPGTRWLLSHLPGVEVEGWRGALLGDRLGADRLRLRWAGGTQGVTITGLQADGLRWQWQPEAGLWAALDVDRLAAQRVEVDPGPPSATPATAPASLHVPARLRVAALELGELVVGDGTPLRDLRGRVALGDGGRHRAEGVRLLRDRLAIEGEAEIADRAPFALRAQARVTPHDDSFGATLAAQGPLERIALTATLTGRAQRGAAPPSADLRAELRPFAPWPLAALSGRTEALDLATLDSRAPQTRLSGTVDVKTSARDAPIGAAITVVNALPGRWNEGRLPVARLALGVQASAVKRERVDIDTFEVQFADAPGSAGAAGSWRGRGRWQDHALELDTRLDELRPQRLDARAAAMRLSGPLAGRVLGLPSPAPGAAAPPPWSVELKATLDGRLDAAPQPVTLALEAAADARGAELRSLRAQSGAAVASARASARRAANGDWRVASAGALTDFDPLPWWPGEAGSAWRQGPHRLNAVWDADVQVPAAVLKLPPLEGLPRLSGRGTLRAQESVLAGVPLQLDVALGQAPGRAGEPSQLAGELRLGPNTLAIDGGGDPAGDGARDRLDLKLDAPALAALAPLLRLSPALAPWAPKAGSARATLQATGRWPEIRTQGEAEGRDVAAADLGLAQAKLAWHLDFDRSGRRPLELQADASGLRWGTQRAERLRADLRGSPREHRLQLDAALPIVPPAAAEPMIGTRGSRGTRLQLLGEGAWSPEAAGGGRWRGRVNRLAAGAWDGQALQGESPGQWVDARDLAAELTFEPGGGLVRVQADAGRLRAADTLALRWDRVDIDLRSARPTLALRAEVEPFALAPLLARLQPGIGWRGDLRLAATLDVRAAERFDADIVFERRDGDLQIVDEGGTQSLGLTDLRLALAAHDGTWFFTQALAGRTLGEMAGAVSVRTTPQARWPAADAPIDGVLQARVANLGVWGAWVPPGWRLAGELSTSASIGGRFGAPEYTGQMQGRGIGVRNLLQGVNVSDGDVLVKLQGERAVIERFTLKGGEGTLVLGGGAEFGSRPNARLQLRAERFRLLGRIDRQLTTSGNAALALSADALRLDGRFEIDEGLFDTSRRDAPSLDDDVSIRRATDAAPEAEVAPSQRPRRDVQVAVDVDLGQDLRVRGRGLDTALRGQLRITTPGGRLAVNGSVRTEEGTYAAYGQKLDIERGILAFGGPVDNPRLDILALRPNTDMRVGVSITGTAQVPRVRLYAETDMSETDKLSWLVLGRAPDGLGRTDALLLQRAAVALLAGEEEAPTDQIIRTLGLDELSLKQTDGEVRETVVSLGKQLSRRWYVGYERGVNATTGTWQLIYRIAQRFTLRAQSGTDSSLDIIWTWKFDDVPLPAAMTKSPAAPP